MKNCVCCGKAIALWVVLVSGQSWCKPCYEACEYCLEWMPRGGSRMRLIDPPSDRIVTTHLACLMLYQEAVGGVWEAVG